tara:strand:- start:5354 stop:5863 length:510 start_codon:yes stop_codon:yes gene_type:complete
MKLLLENWRQYLNEMISSEDLRAFDEKYKDPNNVRELEQRLIELGWDPEAVKHHKGESPPYAEIRNVVLNLDKYRPPRDAEMIPAEALFISSETMSDREKKYQDYKAGKLDKYFRDDPRDPDEMDFEKLNPITVVQEPDGKLEVADGNHRAFLAKKNNASLPAWVIRLK